MAGAFGFSLSMVSTQLAQWKQTFTESDLGPCDVGGQFYNKALTEVKSALFAAKYEPTPGPANQGGTPLAYQATLDLLVDGICLYFVESRRAASYPEGFNNLSGMWGRYRGRLKSISLGGLWGEFPLKRSGAAVVLSPACAMHFGREL